MEVETMRFEGDGGRCDGGGGDVGRWMGVEEMEVETMDVESWMEVETMDGGGGVDGGDGGGSD